MDLISIALQLAFYAVFLVAVWRFVRRPGRVELALLAAFGSMAALFGVQLVGRFNPEFQPWLTWVAIVLLLAQPVFILWLVHLTRPQPRWAVALTIAGFAIALAGLLVGGTRQPLAIGMVGLYFALAEGAAAIMLLRVAQGRHGLARLRLGLAGLATLLFGFAIVAITVGAAASGTTGAANPGSLIGQVFAIGAGLLYLVAFVPPIWLHGVGQRAVAFDLGSRLVNTPPGTEPEVLWRSLANAGRTLLGARSVALVAPGGEVLARTDAEPATLEVAELPPDAERVARGARIKADGPLTRIDIALDPSSRSSVYLLAELEGRVLFIDDDLAVLRLLGAMTTRAIEREEAVVRLAEARRELEAQAAARASEVRFRALLEAVPSAVLAVEPSGTVVWATGPTAELLGRPLSEMAGLGLADVLPGEELEWGTAIGPGRVMRAEMRARRADGSSLPVDVAATHFELDDRQYQLYVLSDATWREQANQLRDRFLSVLSHELRTPITSIYGGTHLLISRGERLDDESRREVLLNVASEAERLLRITENLVVLARVERGAGLFDAHPVALRPVLAEFVARESTLWPQLALGLRASPGLPLVAADEDYLAQVLRNLISNAGKYAGADATVEILAEEGEGEVVVRVVDNGPGLTAQDVEHLFELYYRAPDAARAPGAGIGLFVCRNLVEAMGGRIWAVSRDGGGAEFGFSLAHYVDQVAEAGPEPSRSGSQAVTGP